MNIKDFQENISLALHTTFKIGGATRYFFEAKTKEEVIEAIKTAKENDLPVFILGGGSNVLALDEGFEGLVIKTNNAQLEINDLEILVGAGFSFTNLINSSAEASLTGLEWAAGIPGKVGGAVYGNAQVFEENIANIIKEVVVFDKESLEVKKLNKEECEYSEKDSIFKRNKNLTILSATFKLKRGKKEKIQDLVKKFLKERRRQPLEFPSAGSIFINEGGRDPSSKLIEEAGLKGRRVGDAQVSEKHAGFIVNLGKATSKDVLELIEIIKREVKEKTGFDLKEEVQIITVDNPF